MNAGNVRDIREILESIESLKEQADHSHEMHQQPDNAPEQSSLPESLVAEMAVRKADVLLLNDVYRKGISQHKCKAYSSVEAVNQEVKSGLTSGLRAFQSDAEFDQMLSTLMKDMGHQSKKMGTSCEPKLFATGQSEKLDPNELTNFEADIDGLRPPYLNSPSAPSPPQPTLEPKYSDIRKEKQQGEPKQRSRHKDPIDDELLPAAITDGMRTEIANYILVEIKKQISGWIAENLENIVEEALRSVSTEARDAVKARSVL